jgi:predicted kinase
MNLINFKNLKSPYILILVGPTLSGKSFFVRNFLSEIDNTAKIISRDEIVMEVAGTRDYNKAFQTVDQKLVDKVLSERLTEANSTKTSTIVDMTNMVSKRRKQTLNYFDSDFYKVAVVFPILSDEEYEKRNIDRNARENKWIPPQVIKRMINSFEMSTTEEGFDNIISL